MQSLNKMCESSKCQNSTLNSLVEVAKDPDQDLRPGLQNKTRSRFHSVCSTKLQRPALR